MIPIIKHFIEIGDFSLSDLNNSVQINDFAVKRKQKMTASEMFAFCRFFGVIIGHRVKSYNDPFWKIVFVVKRTYQTFAK